MAAGKKAVRARRAWLLACCVLLAKQSPGQRILTADGKTEAYQLVRSVLGAPPETPDCAHPEFGPHITQAMDEELGKPVFVFHLHVYPDNDRCIAFDRQRMEIKTYDGSPRYLQGFLGDTVTLRWRFRLPEGFQTSSRFTHIHQIKPLDGDADMPVITLTPRKGVPDRMQLIWSNGSGGQTVTVLEVPLAPFLGAWVEAYEKLSYGHRGKYSILIERMRDRAVLLAYANTNLDLWRKGTTMIRPKWGIYRSLLSPEDLRDEQVRFDRFCVAKADDDCPPEKREGFTLAVTPATQTTAPGATVTYKLSLRARESLPSSVQFQVRGSPPGATVEVAPGSLQAPGEAALRITTAATTPPGVYSLLITGANQSLVEDTTARLVISGAGPVINAVVNAASFGTGITPGAWAAIFGENLAAATRSWYSEEIVNGKLPLQLDGVSVRVDGKPAALSAISPAQLTIQVPSYVLPGVQLPLEVRTPAGAASAIVKLEAFAPALFTWEVRGKHYAAARHAGDYALVGDPAWLAGARPVTPGGIVLLYGTGFGDTMPAVPSGQLFTRAAPLASSASVSIGGLPAELLWAGLVAPGLYQLNVRVPEAAREGEAAVLVEVGEARSQPGVFLLVRK